MEALQWDPAKTRLDYERDGYAVIEGFTSPDELDQLRKEIHRMIDAMRPDEVERQLADPSGHLLGSATEARFFFEGEGKVENGFRPDGLMATPPKEAIRKIGHGYSPS